jgi:beta-phosphoglucomutase
LNKDKISFMIKAFLFDLNGTMINDMQYHIDEWHIILNDLGANLSIEETKLQCYGTSHDMFERVFPGKFSKQEINSITTKKEHAYQKKYLPHLKLIDGLHKFLEEAKKQNIKMAIGSAAIMFNIDFVLDNLKIRHYFDAIVSADDVVNSKPDGETYEKCAAALNVKPYECIVFEDVPKGVESAANADALCVVIEGTHHTIDEFAHFENVISFAKNYNELEIKTLVKNN